MKNYIIAATMATTMLASCQKPCGVYQQEIGNECQDWNQKYIRTWNATGQVPSCTNGQPLVAQIVFNAGDAPNKLSIGNGLQITLTEVNEGEGGPWTVSDQSGTYQLTVKVKFYPGTSTAGVYLGVPGNGTPDRITYSLYRNKDTPSEVYCFGEYQ